MGRLKFFLQGLLNFNQIGTVTRSGPAMCRQMAAGIPANSKYVIELGAGDGVITPKAKTMIEAIKDRMKPNTPWMQVHYALKLRPLSTKGFLEISKRIASTRIFLQLMFLNARIPSN